MQRLGLVVRQLAVAYPTEGQERYIMCCAADIAGGDARHPKVANLLFKC
jgi:hypothetical protein